MRKFYLPVAVVVFIAVACSGPDRGEYRDMAAEDVCHEAERCGNLGPDGLHETHSDCIIEERKRFNDMWPEQQCGDGRIDADAYDRCIDRALDVACEDHWADWLVAAERCDANEVCVN